eukprot:2089727-Lingulodinium_polyedra.AAC.1
MDPAAPYQCRVRPVLVRGGRVPEAVGCLGRALRRRWAASPVAAVAQACRHMAWPRRAFQRLLPCGL